MAEESHEQAPSAQSAEGRVLDLASALQLLKEGEIELHGLIPWSSNYTFLVTVSGEQGTALAVYKPQRGETPLWDFPAGTLCLREMASYLVSQTLGWPLIPPTVLRDGPHGLGTVQLYIDSDPEQNYFTFRDEKLAELMPIALFDIITNNADRKGGHCLLDAQGRIWAVDHGLTFHVERKLRTVIWDFQDQPIPRRFLDDLAALRESLREGQPLAEALSRLLTSNEIRAFELRIERTLRARRFPRPGPGRHYPWPPV